MNFWILVCALLAVVGVHGEWDAFRRRPNANSQRGQQDLNSQWGQQLDLNSQWAQLQGHPQLKNLRPAADLQG